MSDKLQLAYVKKLIKLARENKIEYMKVDGLEFKVHALGMFDEKPNEVKGVANLTHSITPENVHNGEDEDLYYSVE